MASFVNQLTTLVQLFQKSMLSSTNMESTFSALPLDNEQSARLGVSIPSSQLSRPEHYSSELGDCRSFLNQCELH